MTGIKAGEQVVEPSQVIEGGLYYYPSDGDKFGVSKVLVIDDFAFHIRIYANKFDTPPLDVSSPELSLGGLDSPDGLGIGHAPLAKEGFLGKPTFFICQEPVSEEELEGYRLYLEAMQR